MKVDSGPPSERGRYRSAVLADFPSPDHLFRYTVTSESTCCSIQEVGNSCIKSDQVRRGHTPPEKRSSFCFLDNDDQSIAVSISRSLLRMASLAAA